MPRRACKRNAQKKAESMTSSESDVEDEESEQEGTV